MSGLDGAFLHIETPETPMHVAALYLLAKPEGLPGSFFDEVKRLLIPRLCMSPFFRSKLAPMPLQFANPVWVEETPNIDYHLRQVLLPKPGTMRQLEERVGQLHSAVLDRDYPLWEMVVIDGLESGDIGLYLKVHHAALDGAAGVALANALFDWTAESRQAPADWRAQAGPGEKKSTAELVGAAFKQTAAQYVKLVRHLPDVVGLLAGMVRTPEKRPQAKTGQNFAFGPKTSLNVPITGDRGFAAVSLPLGAIRQMAEQRGVKVNDIVLTLCSGAVRRYLISRNELPRKPLIATMPVSLREPGNTATTIQATLTLVNLATHIADPLKRLKAIRGNAGSVKSLTQRAKSVIPTDFPSLGAPWLLGALATLFGRSKLSKVMPPIANLAISNVPGPQQPLYVAGAKIKAYWPLSIVEHGLGLNVTVLSYCGSLDFGLTVAKNAVPDVHLLAQMLKDAYEELKQFSSPAESTAAVAPRTRRKAAPAVGVAEVKARQPRKPKTPAQPKPPQ